MGLPGTGKTTAARRLEVEQRALRLTKDASIEVPTPGELDGSEPVDDPPAGFASWAEWRARRWPASV